MASLILGITLPTPSPQSLNLSSRLSISQTQTQTLTTTSSSISVSSPPSLPLVYCGRGDRKTARGKRFNHSFGNARPKDKKKGRGPPRVPVPPSPLKKDRFDDNEKIKIEIDENLFTD